MSRNKPFVLLTLAALLGTVAVLALAVGGRGDAGLTVPSANMKMDSNFQAKPVAGECHHIGGHRRFAATMMVGW